MQEQKIERNELRFRFSVLEEELADRINDGLVFGFKYILKEMDEILEGKLRQRASDIMSAEGAANLLGVSTRTLYNWAEKGILPRYQMGGRYYYKYDDVVARLEKSHESDAESTFDPDMLLG